jgi:hypothetical protein
MKYVSRNDLLCRLKMYIIWIYLRAHTVGLGGRIIGLKTNSETENICEEMLRGPDSDIQQQFSGRTKKNIRRL